MDDEQGPCEEVPGALSRVLADIADEREAQQRQWGPQEFPDGSGPEYAGRADAAKAECAAAAKRGELTWRHILAEEFFESLAESDPERLRGELVQTAAVAVQWVQSLDRRHGGLSHRTNESHPANKSHPAKESHRANESTGRTEKLVRDRIPDIIRASGGTPRIRVAEPAEYAALLRAKLSEEVAEYLASGDPSELADVLEVVHALAALHDLAPAELERLRAEKAAERGGFAQRHVLSLRPGP